MLKQQPRSNPNPHPKKLQPVNNNNNNNNNNKTLAGSGALPSNPSLWNTQTTSAGTFQDAPFFVPQFNDDGIDDVDDVPKGGFGMVGKGSGKSKRVLTPFDDEV